MANYVGIDLGGTKVRVALIDNQGKILHEISGPSYAKKGRKAVLDNLFSMIDSLPNLESATAIGAGVPGPVVDGCMKIATNLPGFQNFPFVEFLIDKYNLPVFLDNDANVAGLAEALVGAGKGHKIVYYLTHSTGIGGALIVDGKVISGVHGFAGEIANIIVDKNGTTHNHLNPGAVENLASGTAIGLKAKELGVAEDAIDVFNLARKNDEKALMIIDQMVIDLAIAMSAVAHVCDPGCFVIGGGLSNGDDVYFEKLKNAFYDRVHEGMRDIKIVKAQLEEPGVIGAGLLCDSLID